jgi:hypothetical protein
MRKPLAALVVLLSLAAGRAQAAPEALRCKAKFDPAKIDRDPASPGWNVNCLSDEVFILDGSQLIPSGPASVPLVNCSPRGDMPEALDSTNCFVGPTDRHLGGGLSPAVARTLDLIRARGVNVPDQDQLVFFRADFETRDQPGPFFVREINTLSRQGINEVANIGMPIVAKDKSYVGYVDAGNTRGIYRDGFKRPASDKPDTDIYGPCGDPAIGFFPRPVDYPQPAVCSPGLFTYFDALAQATAAMFGPRLRADDSFNADCVALAKSKNLDPQNVIGQCAATDVLYSMPALKSGFSIGLGSNGIASKPPTYAALELNIWNSLLDLPGSLMGGNTFRPKGNGSFEVGAPPALEGVSPPFEGKQRLRFIPIDLYLMGMQPWQAVPAFRSFIIGSGNVRTHITEPIGAEGFLPGLGPAMGTRVGGVAIMKEELFADTSTTPIPVVPKPREFIRVVEANGGERRPSYQEARQYIRQMWIFITKPMTVMQAAAVDLTRGKGPEETAAALDEQIDTQTRHLAAIQKARRDYARHFYMLTGYKGRVYTTFEGNVDDNAYWEFGGGRDDAQLFTPAGLALQIPGPEPVPNSGGKIRTVMRVPGTPGEAGKIAFNPQRGHAIRIDGDQSGPVPTNVLSIRMRVPSDPELLANLRRDPRFEGGFFATVTLEGGPRPVSFRVPRSEEAYLVPDGNVRNYAVLLSEDEAFKAGGQWTSFTLTPSNRGLGGLEIEYIRFSHEAQAKDSDEACGSRKAGGDGWPDAEDNCPKVYNPSQDDGNGDGVGDACEDYDGDKVANACDNCPALSNSSQRDRDRNGAGDACDPESTEGCFADGAVAGKLNHPSAFGLLAVSLLAAALLWRRRRR